MNNKSNKISIITSILFFTLFLLIPGETSILCPEDQSQVQEGSVNAGSLIYSSFFGGVGNDHGLCIAQDNQGNIILAGLTYSSDFPTTETAYDQTHNGESDVFISKWSSDRTELIFSTVLGGSDDDNCIGTTGVSYHSLDIAVDSANNIVIYGTTTSDDFPVTSGALNETYNGNQDLFLTKLAELISEETTLISII